MSIIEAIILGLIQGLTEFIPVSSSGHLLAAHELFGANESTLAFDVALHIGTLLALIIFFWKDLVALARNVFAKNEHGKLARIIILATIPAAATGFLFADWIDENLRRPETVVVTMTIMGLLMLAVEHYASKKRTIDSIKTTDGLQIGIAQALALVPGVSRSGATITMGMIRGLTPADAARMSFLMAVPITAGAILGSLLTADSGAFDDGMSMLVVGILSSLVSGIFAIKFLISFLSKNSLKVFGIYRLVFAVGLFLFLVLK